MFLLVYVFRFGGVFLGNKDQTVRHTDHSDSDTAASLQPHTKLCFCDSMWGGERRSAENPRILFSFHRTQCQCTWARSGLKAGLRVCKGKKYLCVARPPVLWCAGQKLWTENLKLFCCIKGQKKDFSPPEQAGLFESTSSALLNTSQHFDLWSTIRDLCLNSKVDLFLWTGPGSFPNKTSCYVLFMFFSHEQDSDQVNPPTVPVALSAHLHI